MDYTTIFIFLSIFISFYTFITKSGHRKSPPPPGPYPLPIIGSIFKLGDKPHHSLAALSKTYGPLIQNLRNKKVHELLQYVTNCWESGKPVNVGQTAITTTLNILSNFIFSIDIAEYDSVSSQDFKNLVWGLMEVGGTPNLADFFPVLRPFDPQGLRKRAGYYAGKLMAIFDQHISARMEARTKVSVDDDGDGSSISKDLTDLLLDISQSEESSINMDDIKSLLFDFFLAGTDSTSSTLEWAMAELIHNPEKMSKARSELIETLGNENESVEESDISKLPYLQAVVKETLRLHPPVTFLVPHKATTDVEIQGYMVQKDSQVLCNLWVMGQDPNVWSNPQSFEPERFFETEIDYEGHDFELIPFGAGRRICPGLPLAHRLLHVMLGSLIYKFNWKVERGPSPQDMDMTDKFGFTFTLHKNLPLMAIPVKAVARNQLKVICVFDSDASGYED
ncbi:hypothetical protein M8C21_011734 [Ambrosia artemisiifolia]|uniref:Cytochrome P450 n=1 Tax=Ambrosia artemisiifolia TaxID=4212 RepID=A0AAD5G1S5_AMBAR|nr:hypothetical protein M8C21_011734 [Ambrosia artemisiifolia]